MKVTDEHEVAVNIALLVKSILEKRRESQKTPNDQPTVDISKLTDRAGYASGYLYLVKEVFYQACVDDSNISQWRLLLPTKHALVEYVEEPALLAMSPRFNVRAMFRIVNGLLEIKFSAITEHDTIIETFTMPSPKLSLSQALAYLDDVGGSVKTLSTEEDFYLTYVDTTLCSYSQTGFNTYTAPKPYEPKLEHLNKTQFTIVPSNEIPRDPA